VVTLFTSSPALTVVFCFFVVVCLVLFSLVSAAFLANKDVYIYIYTYLLNVGINKNKQDNKARMSTKVAL